MRGGEKGAMRGGVQASQPSSSNLPARFFRLLAVASHTGGTGSSLGPAEPLIPTVPAPSPASVSDASAADESPAESQACFSLPSACLRLSASTTAACAAVISACRLCFGEDGGENVGDGDEGVGGSAVSFHTRCVTSFSPSAAARTSRSSSAAESDAEACLSFLCRLGDSGGEHVGDGERGVGGKERSSPACIAPSTCPPSRKWKPLLLLP